jgi:2',3'-cyclic-nucleotide 2'-phosphodiesterase (5'-nucleotidase family)
MAAEAGVAPSGMAKCIADFKKENPGQWVIGVLSHAGLSGDQQMIRDLDLATAEVSFVVGGHDHENYFPGKVGPCLEGGTNGSTGAFACLCAS